MNKFSTTNEDGSYDYFSNIKNTNPKLFKYLIGEIEQIDQSTILSFKIAYKNFSNQFSKPPSLIEFQVDIMFALEKSKVSFGLTELNQRVSVLWDTCGYNNINEFISKYEFKKNMSEFDKLAEEISLAGNVELGAQPGENPKRKLSEILKSVDNNKIEDDAIHGKPSLLENLGIFLMFINILYFTIEFIYRIFSNKVGVFYLWGHYDEVYELSGMLLLLSIFGLNYYYSKSEGLKQIIDDFWQIIKKLTSFLLEVLSLKTVQNILFILIVLVVLAFTFGVISMLLEYWYIIVIGLIVLFLFSFSKMK